MWTPVLATLNILEASWREEESVCVCVCLCVCVIERERYLALDIIAYIKQ